MLVVTHEINPLPRPATTPMTPGLRLALSARAMARVLDVVDYGLLLVAEDGRPMYANHLANEALAAQHPLRWQDGLLTARLSTDAAALQRALMAASRRGVQSLLTLGVGEHNSTCVSIVPLGEPGEAPATLVVLGKRQACEDLSREAFARHHGLTLAETRVLELLCAGRRPGDIAQTLGVKLSTVRTQIGCVREKTGERDIRAIVQAMSRLPPLPRLLRLAA